MKRRVICPYCQRTAVSTTGKAIYPGLKHLHELRFWLCKPCDAWVGTHKDSKDHAPLGSLANRELRQARIQAHAAFDPLWKTGARSRTDAYHLLAKLMKIPPRQCHISWFDVDQCHQVIRVLVEAGLTHFEPASSSTV